MGSICWYCCSEPKEVGPPLARNLRVVDKSRSLPEMLPDNRHFSVKEIPQILLKGDPDEDVFDEENPFANSAHADERMTRLVVDDSNRKQFDRGEFGGDEVAYMKAQIETFRKKEALTHEQRMERHLMNYDHISFNAYEWMLAVKTEYYFRYEGTFATPPCSETVHWRIMKDPIQVHPDQIKELERLLAWRIAPKGSTFKECQRDTAGKDRPGREGNAVDLNRPIQSTKPLHRMVFCECQDWRSKFEEDRRWCRRGVKTRLYEVPYGFSEVLPIVANRTIALNGTYF
jgi:Eukaryotic-type carbonic anhydrase